VACLRRAQGHPGRFVIANLSNQDDVRILTQPVFQSFGERRHITAYLALCHNRAGAARENVLDRFFERDDPVISLLSEQIDQHRQRGCFPGSRDSGNQNESIPEVGQAVREWQRKARPGEIRDIRRDDPKTGTDAEAAHEVIDPQSPPGSAQFQLQGKVGIVFAVKLFQDLRRTECRERGPRKFGGQHGPPRWLQPPMHSHRRPMPDHAMQVRGPLFDRLGKCLPKE